MPQHVDPGTQAPSRRVRRGRAGFTLVEILAVMAILALLVGLALNIISRARATSQETACQAQLRDIAMNIVSYVDHRNGGKWPKESSGVKFLLTMVKNDYYRGDALKNFACPGTDDDTATPEDSAYGSAFKDWDAIDTDAISYAGRNTKDFGIRKDRLGEEIIAADDNWFQGAGRPNHGGITNVVYADAHIGTVQTSKYKGELPDGQDWLPVGPESPDENLKKLTVD